MGEGNQDNKEINNIVIVARPQPSSFSGMHVWSVAAAKRGSGVRVHGGNGNKSTVERSLSWNVFVFQMHSSFVISGGSRCLVVVTVKLFNDGE